MTDDQRQLGSGSYRPRANISIQLWLPADHLALPLGGDMIGFNFGADELAVIRDELDNMLVMIHPRWRVG